jgi:photosystem II stability/assembly factor-like uncharacterized protein
MGIKLHRIRLRNLLIICGLAGLSEAIAQPAPTSPETRMAGAKTRRLQADSSRWKDIGFRNIGPSIQGGRVDDLEVNPTNPAEFYVAYATGGLWHTQNNGQSFDPIFDDEATIVIGDIAVNWNTREIWVGTGEVNSSRSSYSGLGVFHSRDNGKTWQHLGLTNSHHIGKILLHPQDPATAWVAVMGGLYSTGKDRGVYKTTDGGKTWKQTLFINDRTGAVEMDMHPSNPNVIYVATWERTRSASNFVEGGPGSGIHKSSDGGETWSLVSGQNSGFPQGAGIGRIGIATTAASPATLYAVVDNYNRKPADGKQDTSRISLTELKDLPTEVMLAMPDSRIDRFLRSNGLGSLNAQSLKAQLKNGTITPTQLYRHLFQEDGAVSAGDIYGAEVYRSDDEGRSWKRTHDKPLTIYNTYGYYFGKIFVSPKRADRIVILGFSADLSDDGGKTFKVMDKSNTHADWHALWMNPKDDRHMVAGNDGGANVTYDDGAHWFKANTPPVGQFYAITVDNDKPYNVYGGMQDNGSWYGPSNHKDGIEWMDRGSYGFKPANGGDGMQAQVDPRDNRTFYSGLQFGIYSRFTRGSDISVPIRPVAAPLTDDKLRFNWQTPIQLSFHNPDILYMGSNRLHRSFRKGEQLTAISGDLTGGKRPGDVPYGTLTSISESPLRFGLIYTGSDDGYLHMTRDGGVSWQRIGLPDKKGKGGLPSGLWVSRVLASKFAEGRVYVTLNGYRNDHFEAYVYKSEDFGQTWTKLGQNLPAEPVNVIREDGVVSDLLYLGTDGGAYASIDGGATFQPFVKGLPHTIPVHDIAIQDREQEIVLGTHGRSLFIGKIDALQKAAGK